MDFALGARWPLLDIQFRRAAADAQSLVASEFKKKVQ